MIIDYHHHLQKEDGYAEKLIAAMDEHGVDKVCLSGLGIGAGRAAKEQNEFGLGDLSPTNDDVTAAFKQFPDHIIPIGVLNLGRDTPETVDKLKAKGFRGLKIIRPPAAYNDDAFMPVYERAEALELPVLFHTGMVLVTEFDAEDDVCSMRMSPMTLDRVARRFPRLHITLAHMGMPWFDEAAVMARFHPNVYLDITASPNGWRGRMAPCDFSRLLYWKNAFDKLIFGTDVRCETIGSAIYDQRRIFDMLNLPEETHKNFYYRNAAKALRLDAE